MAQSRKPVAPGPVVLSLSRGARLLRIYDSGDRFDHHLNPDDDNRGIHYSAKTLEGCLVEVFGDDGLISTGERRLGSALLKRSLKLLDLHGEGAWQSRS